MQAEAALERAHVHHHLWRAERLVRRRDVSELDRVRQLCRALLLDALARYRRVGRFPLNVTFAARTPHFVDAAQTRCAVAHLLELSGEGALVRRIARERNDARVHELADEPRLVAWLAAVGLTLEEAAAIQPDYGHSNAACICGGWIGAGAEHPGFGYLPARAVLIGDGLNIAGSVARIRIKELHGSAMPFELNQEVLARIVTLWPDPLPSSAEGTWVVAVPQSAPTTGYDIDAAFGPSVGSASQLTGAPLSADGTYTCQSGDFTLGPVTEAQLIEALQAESCRKSLGRIHKSWGHETHDALCATRPGAAADDLSPLAVLLIVASSLLLRRRVA